MFDLWHFAEEAFSVWQNLLYSPGETELQCGTENSGVGRDLCWQLSLTASWELPLLCSVPVLQVLPGAESSEPGALWGQFPLDWQRHRQGHSSCCPLPATAPRTGGSCACSPAPGTVTLHSQALNSDTRLKINSFGSYSFQRNWGEGGGKANKQEIQFGIFCMPISYSSNPQHLLFT